MKAQLAKNWHLYFVMFPKVCKPLQTFGSLVDIVGDLARMPVFNEATKNVRKTMEENGAGAVQ